MVADNPMMGSESQIEYNPYTGMSDQYRSMKQSALDDVVKNYTHAVKPGIDASSNHFGAFGGGGHRASIASAQDALARNLGRTSSEMDVGQWDKSAGLTQQNIGLDLQAQLADLGRNTGLYESALNRGVNAQQTDLSRASNAWQQERQRQMGAFDQALQGGQFDQNNARNMIGIGDIQRGYTQDLLNSQYGDWQQQMNYPQTQLDAYANALARASGNYGSNTMLYGGPQYQANPFAQAIGGAALGAAGYNSFFG